MPNKPIKQGYKLYGIADHGYIYSWVWSSKKYGLEVILPQEGLTNTGAMVHALISTLPRSGITIYMDNYFTSVPLFKSLRGKEYGAVGTTRAHEAFPKELIQLKSDKVKLEWNTLFAKVSIDLPSPFTCKLLTSITRLLKILFALRGKITILYLV